MLFMEDHYPGRCLPALTARRDELRRDGLRAMSAGEVMRLTRIGRFEHGCPGSTWAPMALLKKAARRARSDNGKSSGSNGAQQMKMLRRLPKILRFIPGTAQDVRAYFLTLQYWLAGSDDNVANLVRLLVDRYADGPRRCAGSAEAAGAGRVPGSRRLPPTRSAAGSAAASEDLRSSVHSP